MAKWKRINQDLHQFKVELLPIGCNVAPVVQWVCSARESSWDLQDGRGHVYAHGGGVSLDDCKSQAKCALHSALNAVTDLVGV